MFGCPYNFYPEKPWLRRTIRGMIATGVVVASPVLVAGAVTAAVTVLPPLGIYKLIKRVRSRRRGHTLADFPIGEPFFLEPNLNDEQTGNRPHGIFPFDFPRHPVADEIMREIRSRLGGLPFTQTINEDEDFPLAIFADMDVEHLFSDDDEDLTNPPLDFRTCPTTPATTIRQGGSQILSDLSTNNQHPLTTTEY